jgi:ABC-type oligopeptide transport system substrate-binding subunit
MYSNNANTAAFAPGPAFDALAEQSLSAQTTAEAQQASAKMMTILIADEHIVVPLAAAHRIYAMAKNVSFTDPHPSFPNQTWFSLSMTRPKS